MKRNLAAWLETIGAEFVEDGTGRTNDEMLARHIWQRAKGYTEEFDLGNGQTGKHIHPPDARAQQFIFERREGKFSQPQDESGVSTLEKIDRIMVARLQALTEPTNEHTDDDNFADVDGTVPAPPVAV